MSASELSKELGAMAAIERALAELNDDERARVLTWASSRFNVAVKVAKPKKPDEPDDDQDDDDDGAPADPNAATTLAEFYDQANPTTEGEKVLVVGYWYQFRENVQDLDSQQLNSQLKHLGHGIGNVTRALEWPKSQKPALMVQKRKEGTSKQARKKFAVTNEGKKYVEKMLAKKQPE
jgi:hypothetical protein